IISKLRPTSVGLKQSNHVSGWGGDCQSKLRPTSVGLKHGSSLALSKLRRLIETEAYFGRIETLSRRFRCRGFRHIETEAYFGRIETEEGLAIRSLNDIETEAYFGRIETKAARSKVTLTKSIETEAYFGRIETSYWVR